MKFQVDSKIFKDWPKFQLQKAITQVVNRVQGPTLYRVKPGKVHLEHPENEEFGDYSSNIAMQLFSKLKAQTFVPSSGRGSSKLKATAKSVKLEKFKTPMDLAEAIVRELRDNEAMKQLINKIEAVKPGFINISIKTEWLVREAKRVLKEEENYGKSEALVKKKILLEHTSPDPIKTMHIGHLRNNFLGMSVYRILQFLGAEVVLDCINNDRGTHVCQAMIGFLAFANKNTGVSTKEFLNFSIPEEKIKKILSEFKWRESLDKWVANKDQWWIPKDLGLKSDHFDLRVYAAATKAVKLVTDLKEQVREILRAWEAEEKEVWQLWRQIIDWSLSGYEKTYKRIGSHHDKVWHESNLYKGGKQLVYQGLKKGIFRKSKGAIVTNLSSYSLPETVMIKSDGTALYITFDINLTKKKKETFPSDLYIWDIGNDQKLYLEQQFAVCEQLGIAKRSELFHLNYGYVYLKGKGKMSSREGTIVSADQLIDSLVKKAGEVRVASKKGKSQKEDKKLDETIGLAALKYAILKNNRSTDMNFDIDESISLEGNSGPYLQYTYARAWSVLRKSQIPSTKLQTNSKFQIPNSKFNLEELAILRWLYCFPEVVLEAGEQFTPNLICNFLYDLAQRYNSFYNKHRILELKAQSAKRKATTKNSKLTNFKSNFRLLLTASTAQILKNGLQLLGIEVVEKM